ncbi:MAG: cytochrome P450 [Halioglobus sp.]|nr:cytochrome P450 [Halioglobus sp.]
MPSETPAYYANNDQLSRNALKEIPFLQCVIIETLRLHPLLVTLTWCAREEFVDKGFRLPAGSNIMVST